MSWLLPVVVTAAAAGLTYLFCVRPMTRGSRPAQTPHGDVDFQARVSQLRLDIERARTADTLTRDPAVETEVSPVHF